jgi:hypothetical protein
MVDCLEIEETSLWYDEMLGRKDRMIYLCDCSVLSSSGLINQDMFAKNVLIRVLAFLVRLGWR